MESDTHWHLYDDWEGEFLSTGGKLCSGEAGLQLLTPTMLTAIGELYALKAFRFQHIPEQAAAALEEVKPQLRLPDPLGWKSPISAKQRAAEEHAAVQPEKGKTYPLADEQETDQTPLRDRDPDSVFPLDLNCPGYTQEILEALSNDTLHSVWSSWGIPEAKWPAGVKEMLKKHVPGSGYAWETRLLRHLGEMPTELICRWVKALKSSMTRAELRAYVKRRPDFTADMLP